MISPLPQKSHLLDPIHSPVTSLRLAFLAFVLAWTAGCGDALRTDYTYTRHEPAVGRSSPTVFTIRLNIDRGNGSVVWLEEAHDSDGDLGSSIKTWKDCTFLDNSNWECAPVMVPSQGVVEQIQMHDGKLHQTYWTEQRVFRTRHRVLGVTF